MLVVFLKEDKLIVRGRWSNLFFFFFFLIHEHYHFQFKRSGHPTHAYLFSLEPHPTLIQRGGGGGGHTSILHMPIHFPIGPRPTLAQKKGEPPLDPPMISFIEKLHAKIHYSRTCFIKSTLFPSLIYYRVINFLDPKFSRIGSIHQFEFFPVNQAV